jgi:hypothetical protein
MLAPVDKYEVKVKVTPWHAYAGTNWRRRDRSNPFTSSALEGGGWSASRPGCFTPWKDPVPIVQQAVWAPGFGLQGHGRSHHQPRNVRGVANPNMKNHLGICLEGLRKTTSNLWLNAEHTTLLTILRKHFWNTCGHKECGQNVADRQWTNCPRTKNVAASFCKALNNTNHVCWRGSEGLVAHLSCSGLTPSISAADCFRDRQTNSCPLLIETHTHPPRARSLTLCVLCCYNASQTPPYLCGTLQDLTTLAMTSTFRNVTSYTSGLHPQTPRHFIWQP